MSIYNKPISFTLLAAGTILVGTIAMVVVPMFMPSTQPHSDLQKSYSPIELAGRDVYQAEGCNNCHTQTIRPLKAEVARYGPYSKAWEFEYDKPFIWGSKRTGPDLARIGGKYSDNWHYRHFADARKVVAGSNMPNYGFLAKNMLNPATVESHIKGIGFTYTSDEIKQIAGQSELDALVAYLQMLGMAVPRTPTAQMIVEGEKNPNTDNSAAIAAGKKNFDLYCVGCHSLDMSEDFNPELVDVVWIGYAGDFEDWELFQIISRGTREGYERQAVGGMPPFGEILGKEKIWTLVSYIRSQVSTTATGAHNE